MKDYSMLTIKFKGDKKQLHQKLRELCEQADRTQNGLVIELIEEHLNQIYGNNENSLENS